MALQKTDPRARAVALMTAVTEQGEQLQALIGGLRDLPPEDRARAQRLATGALRWANRSDRLIGPHIRLKPEDAVMNTLRLALYEIHVADTPPHAAVSAAVSITTESKRGLVNGVLRNIQRKSTDWNTLPVPQIPKWLRKRLIATWGKEAVADIETVQTGEPPLDITVAKDPDRWAKTLGAELLPTGSLRLDAPGRVSALPGYEDGTWWVQDAAAALPARLLPFKAGDHVLDMCAAPGGKTMQLAAAGARVTALDQSEARMERLRENLARTSLDAEIVVADALKWDPKVRFDAVLLDAPCSATGTLRRHPDLVFAKDGSELETLLPLQSAMIDCAVSWLKPGGWMVFCTCSLLPEEGENQLTEALARHPEMRVMEPALDGLDPAWKLATGGLRIRPDHWATRGGIDGFFIALLQKAV